MTIVLKEQLRLMGIGSEYPTLEEAKSFKDVETKAEKDADDVIKTIDKSGGVSQVKKSKRLRRRIKKSAEVQSKASKLLRNSDRKLSAVRGRMAKQLKDLADS